MGDETKMNVLLDISPLHNENSIRGVGVYTRFLEKKLRLLQDDNFHIFSSSDNFTLKNIEIVHYPFFDLFFRTLPLKTGRKTVVTIHDVIPLLFPKFYPVGIRGKINFLLQKQSLRQVDAVITDSQTSKKDINKFLGVPLEKIHVVYLAGNPEIQKVSKNVQLEVRIRHNLPEQYILYVGDINYNKNVVSLIESLTLVDESIHLVCVGKNFRFQPIPEWKRISNAVKKFNLGNRVQFIDKLSENANQDLSALYSSAEVYVQPSYYEGFGLPVLEALQCTTPVVAGNNSSLLEIGGKVVEFADTTPLGIAEKINFVMKTHKKNDRRWQEDVRKHLQKFSWDLTAKKTKKIYQSI